MNDHARQHIRLILDHLSDSTTKRWNERLGEIYHDHAAKGLLKSGATIKAAIRAMGELGSNLISDGVDQVAPIAKDVEALAMVRETVTRYLMFLEAELTDVVFKASGNRPGETGNRSATMLRWHSFMRGDSPWSGSCRSML